ncbi:related to DUF1479 domain protein [Cephalotrichum gorgonifer]|uniref:Related to DUF1479 domain protein n=1 Tax=Cephalotrichum gorgonifer TaxID=2041049 RepID=A0AAE8MX72_9PEZI|nr:related to DUF1479 domain protein [Cephalotrichum gorgonifer]
MSDMLSSAAALGLDAEPLFMPFTPLDDTTMPFTPADPIPLPARFARIKEALIAGRELEVAASWNRLLSELRTEIASIAAKGPNAIPVLDFNSINDPAALADFTSSLRTRGAGIVRGVISPSEADQWTRETETYLGTNPEMRCCPTRDPHLFGVYWTPAQIKGRAHPNVIATQRLAMRLWHSDDPSALVSTNAPVAYADRLRIQLGGDMDDSSFSRNAHVEGGSAERWEPDGYGGRGGTYARIWEGRWEEYDPWESGARLRVTSDLYNNAGTCSMFRMFQGWLSLSEMREGEQSLMLCPMLKLSTAYFLLRPFFSPIVPAEMCASAESYLAPENWVLDPQQTSILHGALPSYTQEINPFLHPHLNLPLSMVTVPRLGRGDYILWHPDLIYAIDRPPTVTSALDPSALSFMPPPETPSTIMFIPACPLTQTNALYLARQRKAFLLGHPSPDFGGDRGERGHLGRPGVQDVNEAGGEDGLRAMGLLPFEEDGEDGGVMRMANGILFPDGY